MHFKTQTRSWPSGPEYDGPNDYWKLGSSQVLSCHIIVRALNDRRFYVPHNARKARLVDLFHRMQRGLVAYDGCSVAELKRFIKDRGLVPNTSGSGNYKRNLVAALEKADDIAIFNKFADLPPELRSRIFKIYFNDLKLPLRPAQPPVLKVSRLLRNEALPLFYSTCTFRLRVRVLRGEVTRKIRVASHPDTTKFFVRTDIASLSRIQNLDISLSDHLCRRFGWRMELKDIRDRTRTTRMDQDTAKLYQQKKLSDFRLRAFVDRMDEAVAGATDAINSRSETHELRESDVELFVNAFMQAESADLAKYVIY